MEKWKRIKGFKGYEVSDHGNIRSVDRTVKRSGHKMRLRGLPMKLQTQNKGYLKVNIRKNGMYHNELVHRIVGTAFIPNPENKPCINHKNGIRTDNHVSNIEWCTYQENTDHWRTVKHVVL